GLVVDVVRETRVRALGVDAEPRRSQRLPRAELAGQLRFIPLLIVLLGVTDGRRRGCDRIRGEGRNRKRLPRRVVFGQSSRTKEPQTIANHESAEGSLADMIEIVRPRLERRRLRRPRRITERVAQRAAQLVAARL